MLNLLKKSTISKSKLIEIKYYILFIQKNFKNLDTNTLTDLYYELVSELYTRDDFCNVDDLKLTYWMCKREIENRGVKDV